MSPRGCAAVTVLGASISSTFTITVQCAPQLSCPTSAVVQACTGNGAAAVAFSSQLSATDYNGESLTSAIVCSSQSGASFGCGTTAIECSGTLFSALCLAHTAIASFWSLGVGVGVAVTWCV